MNNILNAFLIRFFGGLLLLNVSCNNTDIVKTYNDHGGLIEEFQMLKNKKHGFYYSYYKNNKISEKSYYKNGLLHGKYEKFYENGNVDWVVMFENGEKHGTEYSYYNNGKIEAKTSFKNGLKHGMKYFYYENGNIKYESYSRNDTTFYSCSYDSLGDIIEDNSQVMFYNYDNAKVGKEMDIIYYVYCPLDVPHKIEICINRDSIINPKIDKFISVLYDTTTRKGLFKYIPQKTGTFYIHSILTRHINKKLDMITNTLYKFEVE